MGGKTCPKGQDPPIWQGKAHPPQNGKRSGWGGCVVKIMFFCKISWKCQFFMCWIKANPDHCMFFLKKTQNRFTTHPPCGWWGFWFGLIKRCWKRDCFIKITNFSQAFLFPNSPIPVIFCFRKPRFLASVRWGYFLKFFSKRCQSDIALTDIFKNTFYFTVFVLNPLQNPYRNVCVFYEIQQNCCSLPCTGGCRVGHKGGCSKVRDTLHQKQKGVGDKGGGV